MGGGGGVGWVGDGWFEIPEVSLPVGFRSLRVKDFSKLVSVALAVCTKCYLK